jgi:GTP-binding protein
MDLSKGGDPCSDFKLLRRELELYSPTLAAKPCLIVANKIDISGTSERLALVEKYFHSLGFQVYPISGRTGQGVTDLLSAVQHHLFNPENPSEEPAVLESTEDGC